jgi:pimeloyl-ACP methyl ester carboxylesterase
MQALFAPGRPLDATRYFLILPDNVGHGKSSKPSDGLKAAFPKYGYADMVDLQHRLVTEKLGIEHLHAILGMSMGGMNAWQWAEAYPNAMDGIMPVVSMPIPISGRNMLWRRIVIDAIRSDPQWNGGMIISCNLLLGWQVVLNAVEGLGFHIGSEKALIATLAAIVLFLAGDIVDTLVFPRKEGANRWKKIFQDIMLALLICAFFFLLGKRWKPLGWFGAVFVILWLVQFVRSNHEKEEKLHRKSKGEDRLRGAVMKPPPPNQPEKFVGLLKRFQSSDLIAERDDAGKILRLKSDQYAASKSLATAAGKYNWTSIYFQNEAAKFLLSLIIPALVTAGFLFYRRHWVYAAARVSLCWRATSG